MQSISLTKLAGLMDMDETSLRSQLMLLKQVRPSAKHRISAYCVALVASLQQLHACVPAGQTREHTHHYEANLMEQACNSLYPPQLACTKHTCCALTAEPIWSRHITSRSS